MIHKRQTFIFLALKELKIKNEGFKGNFFFLSWQQKKCPSENLFSERVLFINMIDFEQNISFSFKMQFLWNHNNNNINISHPGHYKKLRDSRYYQWELFHHLFSLPGNFNKHSFSLWHWLEHYYSYECKNHKPVAFSWDFFSMRC